MPDRLQLLVRMMPLVTALALLFVVHGCSKKHAPPPSENQEPKPVVSNPKPSEKATNDKKQASGTKSTTNDKCNGCKLQVNPDAVSEGALCLREERPPKDKPELSKISIGAVEFHPCDPVCCKSDEPTSRKK